MLRNLVHIRSTHTRINPVKKSKINLLTLQYEIFKKESNKTIMDMFTMFSIVINGLKPLGENVLLMSF